MLTPSSSRWLVSRKLQASSRWCRLFASTALSRVHLEIGQLRLLQPIPRRPALSTFPIVSRGRLSNSTMAFAARLERLRKIVQQDLDALPDCQSTEPVVSDSDTSGGVTLEVDAPSKQPEALVQPQPEPAPITPEPNTDRRFVLLKDAESSYNPKSLPKPTTTTPPKPATPLPSNNLNRGDLASATQHYSPIVALSKYPYKWCGKTHTQIIASAFFDQGKFWAREWDL
jgi:hypothetical protein